MRALKVRLATEVVARTRALQGRFGETGKRLQRAAVTALDAVLDVHDKESLGIALYERAFDPRNDHAGLYPWEERWLARRLPDAPAALLLGAAGAGREAAVLQSRGYTIAAIEPSARAAAFCRRRLGEGATVLEGSYAELAATVLEGAETPLAPVRGQRFEGVLLGWGSVGHVLDSEDRFRLLRACSLLCPEGPILLSVFRPAADPVWASGTHAFFPWGGFLVEPPPEELAVHARRLRRELVAWLDGSMPCYSLLPSVEPTGVRANEAPPEPEQRTTPHPDRSSR